VQRFLILLLSFAATSAASYAADRGDNGVKSVIPSNSSRRWRATMSPQSEHSFRLTWWSWRTGIAIRDG
jgi:hypothetical protein